jgi:hypothetical protein
VRGVSYPRKERAVGIPVKLTYHLETSLGLHVVVAPKEDLEPSYLFHALTSGEFRELTRVLGDGTKWMERLHYSRELKALLPKWFRRASPTGRFGCMHPDTKELVLGRVHLGWEVFFEDERAPFGTVARVETWPEVRPYIGCYHIDVPGPTKAAPIHTDITLRPPMPDVMEVGAIDREGRVYTKESGIFSWQTRAKLEPKRLSLLWALEPLRVHLVRCLNKEAHFALFEFPGVFVLTCPVMHHATFFRAGDHVDPNELPLLLPNKATALRLGFGRLVHGGSEWPTRMEEIVTHGRPLTWRDHGRLTTRA